jgi:formyltetrahydrofolate-dependent phosphoribosylglycinamide formyltransferase
MTRARVAVLASGRGSNLRALLDACSAPDALATVAGVLSDRADAGALELARQERIPALVIADPRDGDGLTAELERLRAQIVVLAGYLKLVPAGVVRAFRGRMLNIHPALLPAFGGPGMYGARVHRAVLASGARISGATVHVVDEEYDRGPILAQWPVPVEPGDTPESLAARVLAVEHQLLPAVVFAAAEALGAGEMPGPVAIPGHAFAAAAAARVTIE